mgnify:CR=1 FL=1
MNAVDIINKTKNSVPLTDDEIKWLVNAYTEDSVPDYQMSAWLMAVCLNGLTEQETLSLTYAMRDSGEILRLDLPMTADKHSTGGVGDKTTLVVATIVASLGVKVAKMSGRALGFTGGTADKLEAIEGYKINIPEEDFINQVNKIGIGLISSSGNLAPANKKIYALRDVTATVESIPLIASSIMSKKIAAGSKCILLDVKVGSGAFMNTKEDAKKLAELIEEKSKHFR